MISRSLGCCLHVYTYRPKGKRVSKYLRDGRNIEPVVFEALVSPSLSSTIGTNRVVGTDGIGAKNRSTCIMGTNLDDAVERVRVSTIGRWDAGAARIQIAEVVRRLGLEVVEHRLAHIVVSSMACSS